MSSANCPELVAPCGLYCGACSKYIKGSCPGCSKNDKASWCKIRTCKSDNGHSTCAECREFDDINDCKKFNNIFSRFFSFIFKSDRKGSLKRISEVGIDLYAKEMDDRGEMVYKK